MKSISYFKKRIVQNMKKTIKIVFFGDSICFGQGIAIHKGWVPTISQNLDKFAHQKKCKIIVANAGVNGNTTRLALERMPYDIQRHHFDIIIIQFGMNDCNYWKTDKGMPRVSKMAFESNLHEIIDRSFTFGTKKVLLNTNHPTTKFKKMSNLFIAYQKSNSEYNKIIRKVAKYRKDVELNDIEKNMINYLNKNKLPVSKILLSDKLHLSELGHIIYFNITYPKIKNAVKQLI